MGAGPPDVLPPEAFLVALASLDDVGPARLRALLHRADPQVAWTRVCEGDAVRLLGPSQLRRFGGGGRVVLERMAEAARSVDVAALWRHHVDRAVGVLGRDSPSYPAALAADPDPPPVLFHRGDPDALAGVRVAVVGTRGCTRAGFDLAHQLGRDLSAVGVTVVSGLALGIDGAAHAGALTVAGPEAGAPSAAPPVGVVGSGLDVVYPRAHRSLWAKVAAAGLLLSEYPLGTPPVAWHFPARNRIIAGLADVVVVVESATTGGAMVTAELAMDRGVTVMAVPGPVGAPTADGTNLLLASGVPAVRGAQDVLAQLHLDLPAPRPAAETRPPVTDGDRVVLDALGWQPATLETVLARAGVSLGAVCVALGRLEADGWVVRRGTWYERVARSSS